VRFQVPQFIEIEDKVIGPFTFKQFLYLLGGAGGSFIVYRFLPFYLAVLVIVPFALLAFALAFYKVNERPFIDIVVSAIAFSFSSKLYLWKKKKPKKQDEQSKVTKDTISNVSLTESGPQLTSNKLRDLSVGLDFKVGENNGNN